MVYLLGKNLFDLTQMILGVFAGPLLACVALAVSRVRIHGVGMQLGLIGGSLGGLAIVIFPTAAVLWISPIAAATTALVAIIVTRLTAVPCPEKSAIAQPTAQNQQPHAK